MNSNSGTIGRWQGAGLMATTLLGTGVFILPQMTIDKAQSGALVAWILLTLAIIPVALVFGRLASVFPHAAGPAYFVEKAFGRTAGRTIGLIFLLVVPMGAPAAILMTFQFVNALVPISGWSKVAVEVLVIFGLFLINLRGIQVSAKLQFGLTLCIVAVVVVLFSANSFQPDQLTILASHGMPEMPTVMMAAGIAFWSFLGIEAMTHLADDFRRPQQDMIPAMMMGTILVGVIYVACTLLLLLVPTDKSVAMIGVFDQLLGGYGAQVIGILGIASGLATVNVYAASAARLVWSFSCEGILPRFFAVKNAHGVPIRALAALLSVMASVIVLTYISGQELEHLIAWSNSVFVVIYLMAMLAAAKLLPRHNWPLVALGCIFCVVLAFALGASMSYVLVLILVVAPFLWWQKSHIIRKQSLSIPESLL
ncbi:L-methionine/branched-chain amino acid transporter [Shewanella glacialipiscicola]|uniref:L-methionine/branched-chain amino acid transporter n=1 Tax=Shewanella glacialipiscicola TaxID=614069 RepID=UPI0021D8837D|nr:L-methionine/branched-chain amino acid transporter [Shewanella glacialipiscicola]MCU7994311.1 L-methionine/branched-chain amino acid transporter [Shewanella glacialipiscicola]MCU8025782.1 L-methionine/branched-chain amino acid transporter [Shewanella glacialipiscicola]